MKAKNIAKWSVTLLVCALVLGGLSAYKILDLRASIAAAAAYPEPTESVEPATVGSAEFVPGITVLGELVAPQRLDLRNEIAGEITAVNFTSGAAVKAGQLLIQLDTAIEEANLAAARARADLAQLVFDRNQQLFESRVSNQDQLDRARAELSTVLAEITALERTIDKKTLRAPFDGRAGLHTFEVGQYLASNTLITSLVGNTDHMWVDFQVPQFYPRLALGAEIEVVPLGSGHHGALRASILAENTVLNAGNRSRAYRARIPDEARQYVPQTVVELKVPIGPPEPVLQVPALAVQNDPLGQYVFVLREEPGSQGWRAVRQRVQVRLLENGQALLEAGGGLTPGMLIAGAGAFKLYEGVKVLPGERAQGAAQGHAEAGGRD